MRRMQNVRAAVRPKIWVALSLSLYAKTGQTLSRPSALCLARAAPPLKAKAQRAANPGLSVVTVDLGVNRLAVMGAFLHSQLIATQFIDGAALNHSRHLLLNTINTKRAQSGR